MKKIGLLTLAVASLMGTQAMAQDSTAKTHSLKWKWKQGQVLRYRMSQSQKQSMTGFQTMNASSETIYYWEQKVESVDAKGTAVVSITYKRVVQKSKGNGPATDIDSDNKDLNRQDPQVKILTALVDNPFKMHVSASGSVSKVVGVNKIADSIIKDLGNNPALAAAVDIIRNQLSNKAIQKQMEASLKILPEKSVALGYKWTRGPVKNAHPFGEMQTKDQLTFKALETKKNRQYAVIVADHDMKLKITDQNNPAVKMFDIVTKFKDNKSELLFDVAGGYLKKQVHSFVLDMKFTDKNKTGMNLDQEIKQTTSILLLSVKEPKATSRPETGAKKKF